MKKIILTLVILGLTLGFVGSVASASNYVVANDPGCPPVPPDPGPPGDPNPPPCPYPPQPLPEGPYPFPPGGPGY